MGGASKGSSGLLDEQGGRISYEANVKKKRKPFSQRIEGFQLFEAHWLSWIQSVSSEIAARQVV